LKNLKLLTGEEDLRKVDRMYKSGDEMIDEKYKEMCEQEDEALAAQEELKKKNNFYNVLRAGLDAEGKEMLEEYLEVKAELENMKFKSISAVERQEENEIQADSLVKCLDGLNAALQLGYPDEIFKLENMNSTLKREILVKAEKAFKELRFMTKTIMKTEGGHSGSEFGSSSIYEAHLASNAKNSKLRDSDYIQEFSKINTSVNILKEAERNRDNLILDDIDNMKREIDKVGCRTNNRKSLRSSEGMAPWVLIMKQFFLIISL
jgi:molecular chaperone GrpE (heat shock protein)